ncbi:response regulator [Rhodoferax saidenbachensis]|uniref:Virulence sensor protein BvgS n=1 Tax=Rhodoferax saidenbachensis TaxID=1484693 RepID=A0A1P8K8X1_9BURK|nr:response regulator [Rhodoferax saidenbachensis]APW42435.1 hybrid sensor histidine kinase/response regulator [Rhodoferax saidenbachensis]
MEYKIWNRNSRRARLAPVLTLAACALILLAMAALDRFHAYQFEQSMMLVRNFEQTRNNLLSSFQRMSTDWDSTGASEMEMERQSLLQELRRLQMNAGAISSGTESLPNTLDANVSALQARLSAGTPPPFTVEHTELQEAFLALNSEMVRLEAITAERLDDLLKRQQMRYAIGWLLALTAMTLLGFGVARNNRELRAAQTALHENDAQFQRMLDMLPQLVWTCDAQARIGYYNQRWVEYTGISLQDLLDKGWGEVMHPDDVAPIVAQWANVVNQGATSLPEFRMRRRDGVYRWFNAHFGVSHNEQGQPVRWFGSSVDVEDVRSARAALELSEQFHRETLTALNEGVLTFEVSGRVTGCNPSAERVLGVPRTVLLGVPSRLWELSLKDDEGRDLAWENTPVSKVLATGEACRDVLIEATGRSGEAHWLLVNAEPVRNADGQLTAVVSSFRDVTERRRAQLELRLHQERLEVTVSERTRELTTEIKARAQVERQMQALNVQLLETERFNRLVADNIPGRIAYWDKDVRCRFINQTYCEWFDSEPLEIIGRTMRESRGDAYYESLEPYITAALRGEPQEFERSETGRHGRLVVSHAHYVPDLRDGEVQGFFVLATDVTQQKKSEQLLQQINGQLAEARDRATSASQAKSAFLANMSHEIRTPMNAIIGFTYMLRREIQDPLQQQRLAKIGTASNHLLQVINDILDLSKIEAGKLVLERVDFSLDALLTRTCSMVVELARDKGLELVVNIAPLPDRLHGDPTRLMQALLNLLSNAVKFTESGSVSLRVVLLEQDTETLLIRFEVVDTGIGIAKAEFARLFNPFAQAEGSSTRLHMGTGLGLAITRHIAEQMGGQAGGESEPGQGSRFWFTARLGSVAQQEVVPTPDLRGLRALVADDLPEARKALSAMLEGLGLRVDSVANGTLALEAVAHAHAQNDPYRVALLDWAMPGLDGLETGVRLSDTLNPPQVMVLVSTRDHISMHQLARDAGFGAVLLKPVTPSLLLDCLMRLLKSGPALHIPVDASLPVDYRLPESHLGAEILLVEDNPVNQEVATQLLLSAGVRVDVAGDGQQAVQMVRNKTYDLVLMDVQMPRMDGLQATRLLRQDPALSQLPIIAMTANALQEDRHACMDAGMNDHLAKPVDPRLLHQALVRWLPPQRLLASPGSQTLEALPETVPLMHSPKSKLANMGQLVDLDQAYEYCAGQASILMGVMQKFTAHYRDAGANLVQQLQSGQTEEAARLLHSLRGVSATIGATEILGMTKQLEHAVAQNTVLPELLSQALALRSALDTLIAAIDGHLQD